MKLQLLIFLLGATLAVAHFRPGSNFCDDEKERHDTCKPLVSQQGCGCSSDSSDSSDSSSSSSDSGDSGDSGSKSGDSGSSNSDSNGDGDSDSSNDSDSDESGSGIGSGSGSGNSSWEHSGSGSGSWEHSGSGSGSGHVGHPGSGEWEDGDYCFILQVFLNYSIVLDIEIREIFIIWINKTQLEIVQNTQLTEYQILVELYYSLQILFEAHVEIKTSIEFLYIGEWGYVFELEGVCLDIQTSNVDLTLEECIEIDISTGNCPLTEALHNCSENATSSEQEAILVLIEKITVIIKGYYSFSQTLVLIYEEFEAFFIKYPNLKVLIFTAEIEGFGIIRSYYELCAVYWRIENFSFAVGGSVSECKLLKALIKLYSDTTKYSVSQRSDIKQLEVKISNYYEIEIDVQLRIKYFAEQLYEFYILESWSVEAIYTVEIEGYGSIYKLIYAYIYCINNGVTPGDFTVSTEQPTTTTSTTTTTTSTTTKPTTTTTKPTTTKPTTTTTKPTTTKPNGNCGTVTSVNVYSVSTNYTKLLQSIDEDQAVAGKWESTEINQFAGYKKRIYNLSINTTTTEIQKFNSIKQVFTGFAGSTTLKAKIQAIFIITWGTVSQYCSCVL